MAKPTWIAIADDGHGMVADMIRLAVVWGGTHREDDRDGFGRYGYGLPSASVSIGRRFTTFSKVIGAQSHAVTIDLDDMEKGVYSQGHKIVIPEPGPAAIPKHVMAQAREPGSRQGDLRRARDSGTYREGRPAELEDYNRIEAEPAGALRAILPQLPPLAGHLRPRRSGVARGPVVLDGERTLLRPGRRPGRSPPATNPEGQDRDPRHRRENARYSYMPPRFLGVDKDKERGKNNERFPIRADNNGLIILRNHRQIDVVPAKRECPEDA